MPRIPRSLVRTTEVLSWKGLHLFNFPESLCSAKVATVLGLKSLSYKSHRVKMAELRTPYYLGINPRGLVPALVHDGQVVVESNDILTHIEAAFPEALPLLPAGEGAAAVQEILDVQDEYHLDIRTLTFSRKFAAAPEVLQAMGAARVAAMDREDAEMQLAPTGDKGQGRAQQRAWWGAAAAQGIPDEQVRRSVETFREKLAPWDAAYALREFLVGQTLTFADVAIWVDVERLLRVKPDYFELRNEFPHLAAAFDRMAAQEVGEHFARFSGGGLDGGGSSGFFKT